MRALITGDRGFLGRHFKAELQRRGWTIATMDTKATIAQDCRDFFRRAALRSVGSTFDLVVHCAAVVGGRETIENDPLKTAESLSIDAEMFRWAAIARPGRVLYISSSAAYPISVQHGNPPYLMREDDVWDNARDTPGPVRGTFWDVSEPDEIYGWSKVTGELLADRLRRTGVPVTVVRPFSGYGDDQDLSYPFPSFIQRAKERMDPFELWCGDCVRDFIHVDDLVAGALAVAESGTEDPVNLCSGEPTSFALLAEMICREAGHHPVFNRRPDKPQGVAYRVGDPSRMLEYYQPKVSLEEGIRRALGR